jgi:hypothetical protein
MMYPNAPCVPTSDGCDPFTVPTSDGCDPFTGLRLVHGDGCDPFTGAATRSLVLRPVHWLWRHVRWTLRV